MLDTLIDLFINVINGTLQHLPLLVLELLDFICRFAGIIRLRAWSSFWNNLGIQVSSLSWILGCGFTEWANYIVRKEIHIIISYNLNPAFFQLLNVATLLRDTLFDSTFFFFLLIHN